MSVSAEPRAAKTGTRPYALLREGFPFLTTLGMRRFTTCCTDLAIGDEGRLFVLCRDDGQGGTIRKLNWDDEDLGTIGSGGTGEGQFMWPVQILRDGGENLYISDEGTHRITAYKRDGTLIGCWGTHGSDPGQLNRPSGIAFDSDENIWVADTMNHRVQKFTKDGRYLTGFGSHGSGEGQFDRPWGIHVDGEGFVYVVDWHNDRVQKLTQDGKCVLKFGSSGSGDGELHRPAGVTVDQDGDIYVADRGNHRVVQFSPEGRYLDKFIGDATLSKSGRAYVLANPKVLRGREMTSLEPQKRLRGPMMVRFDDQRRMYIPDFGSHRIQVYQKIVTPLGEDDIWAPPSMPFLYNV
ncbi:MAG: NHL repeat-containing protein [Chloroflexota bacterium]